MDYQRAKSLAFRLNSEDRHYLFVELLKEYENDVETDVEWCQCVRHQTRWVRKIHMVRIQRRV